MRQSPFEQLLATRAIDPASFAASATQAGVSADMKGWDGVAYILQIGAGDKTVDLKSQDSTDDSSFTDITSGAITQVGTGVTNVSRVLDIYRPTNRYNRCFLTIGAGGAANRLCSAMNVRYRATGLIPVTQASTNTVTKVKVN